MERETLAQMLRNHGEDDLAERALSVTDAELTRIREVGAFYAFSRYALSMGGARAISLAAIDVLDGTGRALRRDRTDSELESDWSAEASDDQRARDDRSGPTPPRITSFPLAPAAPPDARFHGPSRSLLTIASRRLRYLVGRDAEVGVS